jgi:N-acetylglutamate synthase-like GNAT family acetyltransferase
MKLAVHETVDDLGSRNLARACVTPISRRLRHGIYEAVLPSIQGRYPGADAWLDRRLDDVVDGDATCLTALVGGRVIGTAILTPKGHRAVKLSTIWVHHRWRRQGVGSLLLDACVKAWSRGDVDRAYVTAPLSMSGSLGPFFARFGFASVYVAPDRYGEGRDEAIYEWLADNQRPQLVDAESIR